MHALGEWIIGAGNEWRGRTAGGSHFVVDAQYGLITTVAGNKVDRSNSHCVEAPRRPRSDEVVRAWTTSDYVGLPLTRSRSQGS